MVEISAALISPVVMYAELSLGINPLPIRQVCEFISGGNRGDETEISIPPRRFESRALHLRELRAANVLNLP